MRLQAFRRDPKVFLLLRQHPARGNGIHTDAVRPEIAGQAAGQTIDAGIGRGVGGIAAVAHHVADRGEIDDRPAAGGLHAGDNGLCREEVAFQVDGHRPVPELFRDRQGVVPLVVGGVVDQNGDRPMRCRRFGNGGADCPDIRDIAGKKHRTLAGALFHRVTEGSCVRALHEGDVRSLAQKTFGQCRANPRSAPGDEHGFALQIGEDGLVCHVWPLE